MQTKETCVYRGASRFITKADVSSIPSPIMKACMSPFITKVGVSPISYIEDEHYNGAPPFRFPL
jgi:hypothetical protein